MIRKLLLVAAATAMPLGLIAASAWTATAMPPKVDATMATVSCTGISGYAKFSPAVKADESPGTATAKIKVKLTGCTTNDGVAVTQASASGTLTSTRTAGEDGCSALAGSIAATGALSTKWTTMPKLSSGKSVVQVNSIESSIGGDGNATFTIPGSTPNGTPSGSFQGTDGGAGDTTSAQTTKSAASIIATCEGRYGLTIIHLTTPASGPTVSLS